MLGKYAVRRYELSKMHKDLDEMEALCRSVVRDGGFRKMLTDQVYTDSLWSPVLWFPPPSLKKILANCRCGLKVTE